MVIYIGIDNGVSGSLAILGSDGRSLGFHRMPVKTHQKYTKKKARITRIDWEKLCDILNELTQYVEYTSMGSSCYAVNNIRVFLERPMVNPGRFVATSSALRALESTLICLESGLKFGRLPYQFVDSRKWQKEMLPKGVDGKALKKASFDIGIRLFPGFSDIIGKRGDADALLMAEWARRNNL